MYVNFICNHKPVNSGKLRVRITAGWDILEYPDNMSSPTVSLIETELLISSAIYHKLHNLEF